MYDPVSHSLLVKSLKKYGEGDVDQDFQLRLSAGFHTIFENFHRLYPKHPDIAQNLQQLVEILIQANSDAGKELTHIDRVRTDCPQWFLSQEIVGMMLYVDLFNTDLEGVLEKLDYLEELGVNFVHLMPILKMPANENDGGYAVSSYREVDPRFGTIETLKKVSSEFRQRGMLLMLDMVINHTAHDHVWAQKAKEGDPYYQGFYHFYPDRVVPDMFEASMPQVFPETSPGNFTFISELNQWVMTVFNSYQWDLNYTNPTVFNAMLENLLFLANQGADILRLDALAFMWKDLGTTSQNLPNAHLLIQTLKICAQIARPGIAFLAEAIVAPHEIIKYFGQTKTVSNECDLAYNATLMTLLWEATATKSNKLLKVSLENIPPKPQGTSWITYLRCHDDIGLGYEDQHAAWAGYDPVSHRRFILDFLTGKLDWSFSRGYPFMQDPSNGDARISGSLASLAGLEKALEEKDPAAIDLACRRVLMLHSVILAYGGIPMLSMGDELGMRNDYTYKADSAKKDDNRWLHRPAMDWNKAENRTTPNSVEQSIFAAMKNLISVRKKLAPFADHNNCYLIDLDNEHVLSFGRYDHHSKIVCVANLNDQEEWFHVDKLRREGLNPKNGLIDAVSLLPLDQPFEQIRLQPYQFHWIVERTLY